MGNCQKSFGITIRLLRLSRKLKQEQLAEKPGFSLRHIKSIERGLSDPTLSTLEKIASALSLRVKELFALEEIRRSPKGIGKDLLAQLEKQRERATSILCLQQDSFVQVQVGYLAKKRADRLLCQPACFLMVPKGRLELP